MRCFLGIPLPDDLRDELSEALMTAEKPSNLHRVDERLWHMTLVFLGEIDPQIIKHVIRICKYYKRGFGTFTFNRLECFPALEPNPKVLVANGVLQPIERWRRIIDKLRNELSDFAPNIDMKKWNAHVTLARASSKNECLPKWQTPIGPYEWEPEGFALMQSARTEQGFAYRTIHEFPFSN